MPPGEIVVVCPNCQTRARLPIAAVKRDNFYCSKCFEKVPMTGVRPTMMDEDAHSPSARPKKSSRTYRR